MLGEGRVSRKPLADNMSAGKANRNRTSRIETLYITFKLKLL